jgi:hypothetical protein
MAMWKESVTNPKSQDNILLSPDEAMGGMSHMHR